MGHVAIAAGAWVDALGIHIDDAITIAVVPLAGAACVLCGQAIPAGQIAGAVGRIGHLVAIRLVGAHPAGGLGVWNTDAAGLLKDIAHPAHTLYQLTILADQVLIAVCRVTYNGSLRDASSQVQSSTLRFWRDPLDLFSGQTFSVSSRQMPTEASK